MYNWHYGDKNILANTCIVSRFFHKLYAHRVWLFEWSVLTICILECYITLHKWNLNVKYSDRLLKHSINSDITTYTFVVGSERNLLKAVSRLCLLSPTVRAIFITVSFVREQSIKIQLLHERKDTFCVHYVTKLHICFTNIEVSIKS